jgi:flagellar biosynthesis anti-sigma factor FlgM
MKISNNNGPVQVESYIKQIRQQQNTQDSMAVAKQQAIRTDKVELSRQAHEIKRAAENLKNIPEVREKEVKEIKSAVENGTYTVNGEKTANAMLRDSFENDVILKKIDVRA